MSREQPEVGDIWEKDCNGRLVYVYYVNEWTVNVIYRQYNDIITSQIFIERLQEDYVYTGKSNVNINDLFEVEND